MAIIELTTPLTFDRVAHDLYRDIHKAIRAELFAVTVDAGRTAPDDLLGRRALASHVTAIMTQLVDHAEHEDAAIQPVLERELPYLAECVEIDHATLEARIAGLADQAASIAEPGAEDGRRSLHRLYVELASFTSAYLIHQDVEEREIMPALETAIGFEAVLGLHQAIIGAIPPAELAQSLAIMLPAMNVEDRVEMLGGMAQGAPPEVFEGVWSLAGSVLEPADFAAVGARLGR
ncbi:MAG: hemerythrin domain-containing protein [Acidimicrobiales bacterium]